MKFHKAYKLRIYPNRSQEQALAQMAGNTRWLWNYLLAQNKEHYKKTKKFIFHKEMSKLLPELKREYEWLKETSATSLQQVTRYLDKALKDSFKKSKGFPRFKKKSLMKDSFYLSNQVIKIFDKHIQIPKMNPIKFRAGKIPNSNEKIMSATISQDGDHWYCSVVVEFEANNEPVNIENSIGIDLGLQSLMVTSDGQSIENPRHLRKMERRLKKAQRKLSRAKHKSKKASKNQKRKQLKLYRLHRKIRNRRKDFINKLTTELIANNSVICLETLDVQKM